MKLNITLSLILVANVSFSIKFTPRFIETVHSNYKFYSRCDNHNFFFAENSFVLQTSHLKNELQYYQNIEFKFLNSNIDSICGQKATSENLFSYGNVNHFKNNQITKKELIYHNLYKGIDLNFYFDFNSNLKYDYILSPLADFRDIKVQIEGAEKLEITDNVIRIYYPFGVIKELIPKSYQMIEGKEVEVDVRFHKINDNTYGFKIGLYDKRFPLIIDPTLVFSTYLGGNDNDIVYVGGFAVDSQNNSYVYGVTSSLNFPVTMGAIQGNYGGGNTDSFIAKISPDGTTLLFSSYIGGNAIEYSYDIYIDEIGNQIYLSGQTHSNNFPVTSGCFQSNHGGGIVDSYFAILNMNGVLNYCTYFGGPADEYAHGITKNNNGEIVVAGQVLGNGMPCTMNAINSSNSGAYDGFLAIFNAGITSLIYSSYYGGNSVDKFIDVCVDANNNIYAAGHSAAGYPVTPGAYQTTYGGGISDAVVVKFNPSGTQVLYSTYIGGGNEDGIWNGLHVTPNGEAIVVAWVGAGYPTTSGAYDVTYNGGNFDAAISKLNSTGSNLIYSTYLGSSSNDRAYGLSVNPNEEVWVCGFAGNGFPITNCTFQSNFEGQSDGFFSLLSNDGSSLLFSSFYGKTGYDHVNSIVTQGNDLYVCGITASSNFYTTPGAVDETFNGGTHDLFVSRLNLGMDTTAINISFDSTACQNTQVNFSIISGSSSNVIWNFGDGTTSNLLAPSHVYLQPGIYNIELNTANGVCASNGYGFGTIEVYESPVVSLGNDFVWCGQQQFELSVNASNSLQYLWNTGETDSSITIYGPGVYWVTVNNQECSAADTITIIPKISISNKETDIEVCDGKSIVLSPSVLFAQSYLWSTGDSTLLLEVSNEGTYTLTYEICNEPIYEVFKVIFGNNPDLLFIPNCFTPNDDGVNDIFFIDFQNLGIIEFEILIYNRWGNLVYYSTDKTKFWDGKNSFEPYVNGVYYYILNFKTDCTDELLNTRKGHVSIVK